MKYEVILMPSAKADIFEIRAWLMDYNMGFPDRWLWKCSTAITSLSKFPKRCKISEESVVFDVEVRELTFGSRRSNYRILFAVDEGKVNVLRVRSTKQKPLAEQMDDD